MQNINNFFGEGALDIIKNPFEFQNIEEIKAMFDNEQ